jgi:hypothetical protein
MRLMRRGTYIVDKKLHYRLLGYNAIYFFITAMGELLAQIQRQELGAEQKSVLDQLVEHHDRLKKEAGFFRIG